MDMSGKWETIGHDLTADRDTSGHNKPKSAQDFANQADTKTAIDLRQNEIQTLQRIKALMPITAGPLTQIEFRIATTEIRTKRNKKTACAASDIHF